MSLWPKHLENFVEHWNRLMAISLKHNETELIIDVHGKIELIGNIKDAVIALINYINQIQNNGSSSITLNTSLEVDLENGKLLFHGNEQPSEIILELINEFNKAGQLRIFW